MTVQDDDPTEMMASKTLAQYAIATQALIDAAVAAGLPEAGVSRLATGGCS